MENKSIVVHQAYYGEVNRSHSCINSTIASDKDLNSFLLTFTDRPGAIPPGVQLAPYLSGAPYSNFYIFTKTIPDARASRSGMVFTHALIIDFGTITLVNNLEPFFSLFVNEVPHDKENLEALKISYSPIADPISSLSPNYVIESLAALLNGESPILFSGTFDTFKVVLQAIWIVPIQAFRNGIRFRTSFTPSDIESISNLTIVNIQQPFIPKWSGKKIILSEVTRGDHIITDQEAYILHSNGDSPFAKFLVGLQLDAVNLQNIRFASEIYDTYKALDSISDGDKVRQAIRIISKISPSQSNGIHIKEQFISKLIGLYESGVDTNLKALRNVTWSAFENGSERMALLISKVIELGDDNITESNTDVSDTLILSICEEPYNWWHQAVQLAFKKVIGKSIQPYLPVIWSVIIKSENSLKTMLSLVPDTARNGEEMRMSIPKRISTQIGSDLYDKLLHFVARKKWYMFYADLNLLRLSKIDTLLAQISVEKHSTIDPASGVKYVADQIEDGELIGMTISNCQKELIHLSVDRISRTTSLLKSIEVQNSCWLEIWASILDEVKNISYGIAGEEKRLVYLVLDQIVQGKQIPDTIIKYISVSEFANICEYPQRVTIWKRLPSLYVGSFKAKTLEDVLRSFLKGQINTDDIEQDLVQELTSDKFVSKFLATNRNNLSLVVQLFDSFSGLKDEYLSEYIKNYRSNLSNEEAENLGEMVSRRQYRAAATSIYNKSTHNSSFKGALKFCGDLVKYDWWGSFFGSRDTAHSYPSSREQTTKSGILPVTVVLTAIKEEYMAVREHLTDIREHNERDTIYEVGVFIANGKERTIVFIRECGARNTTSAQETERAIRSFQPRIILFVGIAGSRKPNDFRVGDVIFPEKVYSYEGGKATETSFKSRPDAVAPSFKLLEKAKSVRLKDEWKEVINGKYPDSVKADIGIIASGEQLIEHHSSEIGRILADHYNDTSAVEMEGYGFLKAALRQGGPSNSVLAGVVRGISDILESSDNHNNISGQDQNRRPDDAKVLASKTAAAFAFCLIDRVLQ